VHGANGYLIDQFLHDGSNKRTDAYGGPIEHRARFLLEIVDACCTVWGAGRVGVHLAPRGDAHAMSDSNPEALFTYVARACGERAVSFIFTREYEGPDSLTSKLRAAFGGPVIVNEGYEFQAACNAIDDGCAEAVAFGKAFIANPDLVERFKQSAELNDLEDRKSTRLNS